jgi:crotonobetaine/carnitine-CoA ligase
MTNAPIDLTFGRAWSDAVATRASSTFLRFEGPDRSVASWSYGEFDAVVERLGSWLSAAGVGRGEGVHLALTNSPTFVAVWIAATRLGAFIVPSDPFATASELAEHIDRTSPAVGFCSIERAAVYREAVAGRDHLVVAEIDEADAAFAWLDGSGRPTPQLWPDASPLDRAAIMFTSGTTGRPKGVEVSQADYAFAGTVMAAAAGLTSDDRQIVVLPMFHANAQYYSFAPAIAVGASVALMHTFSASRFIEQVARHSATHASLFAGPMRMILARTDPDAVTVPITLRHCWFAQNLAADQYETLAGWLGCRPRQLYGMTETIPAVLTDLADDPLHDTMGFVTQGCEVDLQDADGRSCPPGVVGEIVVGGTPGLTLFGGYLDDEATTAASYRNHWFLTGDRATRDADGRYRFDGRRADVLKVAGENVSVVEVEAVLGAHPDVLEAVVVGAPDDVFDEVPVAFVVPRSDDVDHGRLVADLEVWAADRLGKAKRPRGYTVLVELPRTSVGKIRKFLLADRAAEAAAAPETRDDSLREVHP